MCAGQYLSALQAGVYPDTRMCSIGASASSHGARPIEVSGTFDGLKVQLQSLASFCTPKVSGVQPSSFSVHGQDAIVYGSGFGGTDNR